MKMPRRIRRDIAEAKRRIMPAIVGPVAQPRDDGHPSTIAAAIRKERDQNARRRINRQRFRKPA